MDRGEIKQPTWLCCEICGFNYNHIKQVYIQRHYEKDEPGEIKIEFDCESCMSRWALVLIQSKGQVSIEQRVIRKGGEEDA